VETFLKNDLTMKRTAKNAENGLLKNYEHLLKYPLFMHYC